MSHFQFVFAAISAVVLFLYGLQGFSKELQTAGGDSLRKWLPRLTANRLASFGIGVAATALLQSSSAVTSLTATLVDASVLSLRSSLGILLGSNVGTTATAWLVSFKLTGIGPVLIVAGTLISAIPWRIKLAGKAIFYFGLIFFALDLISVELRPLRDQAWFSALLLKAETPLLGILIGAFFTALVQSSSVTTGLAIVFVQQGFLSPVAAIAIVVGANIGSTSTALIASMAMNNAAKRTALANLFFNLVGAIVFYLAIEPVAALVSGLAEASLVVAIAHLLFNLMIAMIFLPFIGVIDRQLSRMMPVKS
jgi:phosphate:Na+ symporter